MEFSRRKTLLLGSSLALSSLSGCISLPFGGSQLTLRLLNFDSVKHDLYVEALLAEGGEQSESVVLDSVYELPPPKEGNDVFEIVERNAIQNKKYAVRAHLSDNHSVRGNYLFYPDCTDNEELFIEIVRDDESEEPYIRFNQNFCGSDSLWF
ncbi:hypothetical protein ACFQJC_17185 [Haloferax namakaokahaiae]|uniref:Lipoprotein n=1 Tax=Haloferax namakaokahaiae TaxID=1748331 RepID=A0ABD5ZIY1_9EURY